MAGREDQPQGIPELGEHVEGYLAYRVVVRAVRLIGVPIAVLAAVAGWFGYEWRSDVLAVQRRLDNEIIPAAMARLDSIDEVRHDLQALITLQQAQISQQNTLWTAQQTALLGQVQQVGAALSDVGQARSQSDSSLRLAQEAAERAANLERQLGVKLDSFSANVNQLTEARSVLANNLELVRQRVYGSWSFVVHERRVERLAPLPLTVSMDVIKDGILRDLQVTLAGQVVVPAQGVPLGETICVTNPNPLAPSYRLTPSYIVELFLGDDIAGLQVEQVADGEPCTSPAS